MSGKLKVFKGNKKEVFRCYLDIINSFLLKPLTNLEKDILVEFYMLGEINKDTKKIIRELFKFQHYSALDNYIVSMKKKGVLVGRYSDVRINPNINLTTNSLDITIKFIISE